MASAPLDAGPASPPEGPPDGVAAPVPAPVEDSPPPVHPSLLDAARTPHTLQTLLAALAAWATTVAPAAFARGAPALAGAVEAGVCLMALQGQWLPPTANLVTPEPAARFPIVRQPPPATLEYALTNSFGFGGANASLILRRWS